MDRGRGRERGCVEVAARGPAVAATVATPAAVWLLIGYLSEDGGTDHIVEIPQPPRWIEIGLGVAATVIAARAWSLLFGCHDDWLIRRGWWRVCWRVVAAGLLVAVGGRIVTAGSVGANIGGGMIIMLGPLPLLYLLGRAREESVRLRGVASPGWMPSGFEWLWRGGGGGGSQVAIAMVTGLMVILLIPWPALVTVAGFGGLATLATRRYPLVPAGRCKNRRC